MTPGTERERGYCDRTIRTRRVIIQLGFLVSAATGWQDLKVLPYRDRYLGRPQLSP